MTKRGSSRRRLARPPVTLAVTIVAVAASVAACGSSGPAVPATSGVASVTCASYPLTGNGTFRDEIAIKVQVNNAAQRPARYHIAVELTATHPRRGDSPRTVVTIHGSVASRSSALLGRKVLAAGPVARCRVTQAVRS